MNYLLVTCFWFTIWQNGDGHSVSFVKKARFSQNYVQSFQFECLLLSCFVRLNALNKLILLNLRYYQTLFFLMNGYPYLKETPYFLSNTNSLYYNEYTTGLRIRKKNLIKKMCSPVQTLVFPTNVAQVWTLQVIIFSLFSNAQTNRHAASISNTVIH